MLNTSSGTKASFTRTIVKVQVSLILYLILGGCSQQLSKWCPWTDPETQKSETVTVTVYLPTVVADLGYERVSGEQNQVVIPTESQHTLTLPTMNVISSGQTYSNSLAAYPLTTQSVTLNFSVGSFTLGVREQQKLRDFLNGIDISRIMRVDIEGHTDTTGASKFNKALSIRRAQSVASITKQFVTIPVTIYGFGEELPLVDNKTSAHRAINRRANLTIQ